MSATRTSSNDHPTAAAETQEAECRLVATTWARCHRDHGITDVVIEQPSPGDDPGSPWTVSVWVRERRDEPSYLLIPGADGWAVCSLDTEETVGIGAGLLEALRIIRPDVAGVPA